jgi:streptogramin lyase
LGCAAALIVGTAWSGSAPAAADLTPQGDTVVSEFMIPAEQSAPSGITIGVDRTMWFAEELGNRIATIDPWTRRVDEFRMPTPLG